MWQKLKPLIADDLVFTAAILILVGIISFGLGRASVQGTAAQPTSAIIEVGPEPFIYHQAGVVPAGAAAVIDSTQGNQPFVASRSGTRYHLVTCPGAKQIKEENRIFFSSGAAAEAAGYTKAANCPGL